MSAPSTGSGCNLCNNCGDHVTDAQAIEAIESLDDFARMMVGVDPSGPRELLYRYVEQARAQAAGIERLRAEFTACYSSLVSADEERGRLLASLAAVAGATSQAAPVDAIREVIRISDRSHPAWDEVKGWLATAVQSPWQPIDTAPMDGSEFLGYREGHIANASRVPRDDCEMWSFGSRTASVEYVPSIKPTHWMPKPADPVA